LTYGFKKSCVKIEDVVLRRNPKEEEPKTHLSVNVPSLRMDCQ
jgi:hypothetical protein